MKGTIFDIERNSYVDGPGIRTTVFFKGCNLKCAWCHNPESQSPLKEFLFYKEKCVGCGRCKGNTVEDSNFICLNDAKEICGRDWSTNEVLKEVLKDKAFFDTSGGGVTFSGGECMLQIDFLCELLKVCKESGIHTAVDTAGNLPWEYFEKILPYTDLFLYDIKCMDNDKHLKYTGVKNEKSLENLKMLLNANAKVWIRIPIICGVNDTVAEMKKVKEFLNKCNNLEKIELLPYHQMGEHKYTALGMEIDNFEVPEKEKVEELKRVFD